jgi:hypothetical protein
MCIRVAVTTANYSMHCTITKEINVSFCRWNHLLHIFYTLLESPHSWFYSQKKEKEKLAT